MTPSYNECRGAVVAIALFCLAALAAAPAAERGDKVIVHGRVFWAGGPLASR